MNNKFKSFLINENKTYLGHRVGDILTAAQELERDMGDLGSRHLNRLADNIVNQIRKILHSQWGSKSEKHLHDLQKVAVAIKKTIEDRGDLKEILPTAVQELGRISGRLGVKVNNLEAPEAPAQMGGEELDPQDFELTGDGTSQPPQAQQQPDPNQIQQPNPNQSLG